MPIRVPSFLKVEVEELGLKSTAILLLVVTTTEPLLSITRVLPVLLIVCVELCESLIVVLVF
ncbi:hypothetical protein [Campylobacter sp. TTU_617]|uniref:hypothetical protein n=1 Tax=Campylobacter sp. TTU_617 TaxID=2768148 RepID=UPI0019068FD7|nr:hypothetical protein [Campylobacter sp. TTU_617]MBK1972343.1 hypothetical protein [Campylobacter sp. TTU_617]